MERIKEVIEIIEQTGDKCVVLRESQAYVVMKLEDYRRLLSPAKPMVDSLSFKRPVPDIREFEILEEDRYYPEPID